MDDNGVYGNDAADGQTACIAHEYLCRVGVVPEEAISAPMKAQIKITSSSEPGMYMMFR